MSKWQKCCRGRRSNCPQILVEGRTIRVRDDAGNEIKLTLDQFHDVHSRLKEIVTQRPQQPAAPLGLIP